MRRYIRNLGVPLGFGLALLALMTATLNYASEAKTWVWTSPRFSPCEGIGVSGTFTVHAEGQVSSDHNEKKLTSIAVYVESAAFGQGTPSVAAVLMVTKDGNTIDAIKLVDPPPSSIIRAPGVNESTSKFLPLNRNIQFPRGAVLNLRVTATVTSSDGGSCVLGTTSHLLDLS